MNDQEMQDLINRHLSRRGDSVYQRSISVADGLAAPVARAIADAGPRFHAETGKVSVSQIFCGAVIYLAAHLDDVVPWLREHGYLD